MSAFEIAMIVAGYCLALARLLNVAKPVWDRAPRWAQPLLPALPVVLTQLAGALGAASSRLDLADAALVAIVTITTAMRGTKSASVTVSVLAICLGALSASACAHPPSPAQTYQAALDACNLYRYAPAELRTPEADYACAELGRVCIKSPSVSGEGGSIGAGGAGE